VPPQFPLPHLFNSNQLLGAAELGSRQEIIPQYGEGFWFVIKAHPSAHIEICAGGCNAEDGPKDKQDVALFFAEALGRAGSRDRPARNPRIRTPPWIRHIDQPIDEQHTGLTVLKARGRS
jgi:hypothetical protein